MLSGKSSLNLAFFSRRTIIGMTSDKTGNTKMDNDNAPLNEKYCCNSTYKSEQINVNSQKLLFIRPPTNRVKP